MLIAGRVVQAAGGCGAGMVVTRAIVLDLYGGERAGRVMAGLLAAMMIAPMLATPLGGLLDDAVGWRANFAVIAAAGLATLAAVAWRLPETRCTDCAVVSEGFLGDARRLLASRCFEGVRAPGRLRDGGVRGLHHRRPLRR